MGSARGDARQQSSRVSGRSGTTWLCRFDLLHIMVDEPDPYVDKHLAEHIVKVHQRDAPGIKAPYDMQQVQLYIRFARSFKPEITAEVGCCDSFDTSNSKACRYSCRWIVRPY